MTIEEWVAYAKELGFSEAAPVVPADLKPNAEVRAMCAADKCHAYGKNWTCPRSAAVWRNAPPASAPRPEAFWSSPLPSWRTPSTLRA